MDERIAVMVAEGRELGRRSDLAGVSALAFHSYL